MNPISSSYSQYNNSYPKLQNSKINFGAGWSAQIEKEIEKCNIAQIIDTFEKQGITTDFKDNKVVAWCSLKTLEIFNELNEKYKLKLDLPKAIYVEDFAKLKEQDPQEYGICNWYPAYLKKDSDQVYSERTVLFNSFESSPNRWEHNWKNIDLITEDLHKSKILSTPHFLNIFVHEFGHSTHNGFLLNKIPAKDFLAKLRCISSLESANDFKNTDGKYFSNISEKAKQYPLETISDDIAMKITNSLPKDSFKISYNPFKTSSYPKQSLFEMILSLKRKNKILSEIWNGNIGCKSNL